MTDDNRQGNKDESRHWLSPVGVKTMKFRLPGAIIQLLVGGDATSIRGRAPPGH